MRPSVPTQKHAAATEAFVPFELGKALSQSHHAGSSITTGRGAAVAAGRAGEQRRLQDLEPRAQPVHLLQRPCACSGGALWARYAAGVVSLMTEDPAVSGSCTA